MANVTIKAALRELETLKPGVDHHDAWRDILGRVWNGAIETAARRIEQIEKLEDGKIMDWGEGDDIRNLKIAEGKTK